MDCQIRWMIRNDTPSILAIDKTVFIDSWSDEEIVSHVKQSNCIAMVAEIEYEAGSTIIGYMVYTLEPKSISLVRFAVDPAYWRMGVGTVMMRKLQGKLSAQRRLWIDLVVCERDAGAISFFRAMGFSATKVIRDWSTSGDGYKFRYRVQVEQESA